jgi:hypothetical protein
MRQTIKEVGALNLEFIEDDDERHADRVAVHGQPALFSYISILSSSHPSSMAVAIATILSMIIELK